MAHALGMLGREDNHAIVNRNEVWYGIYSQASPASDPKSRVFSDFSDATVESKKLNARFQKFGSEEDARRFVETGFVDSPQRLIRPRLLENLEKSPARRGPPSSRGSLGEDHLNNRSCPSVHQREVNKFRVFVEKGDLQAVLRCIHENPRYLVSSYDKPVTVHNGSHYNALHFAAKLGQKEIAEHIINYLLSDVPWSMIYPNENVTSQAHLERRAMVIDGYFNTSDKGCGETPLHFACKFGHLDFVRWLLTFNEVDITRRNKYEQTAEEVAGTRCAGTEEIQRQVTQLVQDSRHSVYVPVVRAVDNSTPPFLGRPITPEYIHSKRLSSNSSKIMVGELCLDDSLITESSDFDSSLDHSFSKDSSYHSPLCPSLSICAYAGPMPRSEAKEFRKVWKTPPRDLSSWRRDTLQGIMRSDSERGLERVGRDLAVQQKVAWQEYWEFLGCFANLREDAGLCRLDEYLLNCDNRFIAGNAPSKTDQDVLHALPPGGIGQLADRYPNIANWYKEVLAFPEDERKCWTTPIRKRKTPSQINTSSNNTNVIKNLMSELSLSDEASSTETNLPSPEQDIQNILVQGISNLSVGESNKLFSKKLNNPRPGLCGIDISEPERSTPITVVKERLPLPISSSNTNPRSVSPVSNEPRQRYPKPATSEDIDNVQNPRNRVRRYFSTRVFRWLLIFIVIWTLYFVYVYFQSDLNILGESNRHL